MYIIIKVLNYVLYKDSNNNTKKNENKSILEKGIKYILNKFEYEILIEGFTCSYLNFSVYCFL